MPNKKVIDILPPKELAISLKKGILKEVVQVKEIPRKKIGKGKKGLIFSLFFLILLGAVCYFTLPKAEIDLWPETEISSLEATLTINKEIKEADVSAKVIPAQIFQKEKTLIEAFPSSGKVLKEEKAKGILTVYNAYSTSPQVLVATTRFVSADGKVFRTPVMVTIPGGKYEGGELIPGEINIEVVADQAGPEYNIGRSIFSIPGFAGTDKYTKFYGRSFDAMTGGLREEKAAVTKDDLSKAEDSLTKQAQKECQDLLKSELQTEAISSKFDYFLDEFKTEIIEKFSLATVGEETEEFKFQTKATCQTLIFQKEDLHNFAKESIIQQSPQGYKLYEKSLKIDYSPQTINLDSGIATLSLSFSAKIYSEIDENNLKSALSEKSLLEAKLFLENQPKVTKVNVKFWPFWVSKAPEDFNKIKIEIRID